MKKLSLTLSMAVIAITLSLGQRTLEIVTDPMENSFDQIVSGDQAYAAVQNGTRLRRYDGTTLSTFNYPFRDGAQLIFNSKFFDGFLTLGTAVYMILHHRTSTNKYLYRFNGTSFTPITLPGNPKSNMVIYRDKIHLLLSTTGGTKLFSYDGITVREVPSSLMPGTGSYLLMTGGSNYLYIDGAVLKRYNGGTFRTITGIPTTTGIKKTFQVSGTEQVYFAGSDNVYFYNGTSTYEIFNTPGATVSGGVLWRSEFYFQAGSSDGIVPMKLFKCTGAVRSEIPVPGELIYAADQILYRHKLHLSVHEGGTDHLYSYDGTTFESVFNYPVIAYQPLLRIRRGNLILIPRPVNDDIAFEYAGDVFTEIRSPEEEWIFGTLESTFCHHYWGLAYFDADPNVYAHQWVMAIERPNETCTSPGGGGVAVIPERLREYEHINITSYGPERPWCWTGIDVDWEIDPICVIPPCPAPRVQTTLTDKAGKIAWQKTFDKPFDAFFSVDDSQPYALSLAIEKNQAFGNVLVFDKDLVNTGFDELSFDFYPREKYFYLSASTKKEQQIPFTLTLKNTKNESLWQQQFIAPLEGQVVSALISKSGDYLQVSLSQANARSNVTYYPNPFRSKLNIDVADGSAPVLITLQDMNGKIVAEKYLKTSGAHSLDEFRQKTGLYVLTITEGKVVRRELVEMR
jgi:hypothetical protein